MSQHILGESKAMPLMKTSVQADTKRTLNLLDNLRREFVKMLVQSIPETTGFTYEKFAQSIADRVFGCEGDDTDTDSYFLHVTRNGMLRRADWSDKTSFFAMEMYDKYVCSFIEEELAECGLGKDVDMHSDDVYTEILIEASYDITIAFISVIEEYEGASLDYDFFKKTVDESLTTAYEEISGADSA